jgi:hypothetical protein
MAIVAPSDGSIARSLGAHDDARKGRSRLLSTGWERSRQWSSAEMDTAGLTFWMAARACRSTGPWPRYPQSVPQFNEALARKN